MKRKALCVGVNRYKDKRYVDLSGSHTDATTITSALQYPSRDLRFDVTYLTDPTAAEVEDKLGELAEEIDEESFLVFYFAGHGLTLPYQTGQSLLCFDASPKLIEGTSFAGAIQPVTLRDIALSCRGKMFTLLDTCRSATVLRAKGTTPQKGGKATRDAMATAAKTAGLSGICWALNSTKDDCLASDDGSFANAVASVIREAIDLSQELELGDDFVNRVIEKMRENGNETQLPEASGTPFALFPGGTTDSERPIVEKPGVEAVETKPVRPVPPVSGQNLTDAASAAYNAGRYEEAERFAQGALERNPNDARAKYILKQSQGKLEKSRKIRRLLDDGWTALSSNRPVEALEKAREALRLAPNNEEAKGLENEALSRKDDLEIGTLLRDGWECLNNGDSFGALAKANAVLKRRPENPEAAELKGFAESAVPKAGERMTLDIRGVEYAFRWIPAGSFMMGEGNSQHKVNLSRGIWLLESPITQGMWKSAMGGNPSYFKGSDRLPVEQISWNDCQEYLEKLNSFGVCPDGFKFSLPTEAEWEYACRAGTTTPYWFGNSLNGDMANCDGNYPFGTEKKGPYLCKTTEVGKYPANGWGLLDMHGNVCEWVQDWYGDYPTGEVTDPTGPEGGSLRVLRGGGWYYFAVDCRAADRLRCDPGLRFDYVGARLVLRPLV